MQQQAAWGEAAMPTLHNQECQSERNAARNGWQCCKEGAERRSTSLDHPLLNMKRLEGRQARKDRKQQFILPVHQTQALQLRKLQMDTRTQATKSKLSDLCNH